MANTWLVVYINGWSGSRDFVQSGICKSVRLLVARWDPVCWSAFHLRPGLAAGLVCGLARRVARARELLVATASGSLVARARGSLVARARGSLVARPRGSVSVEIGSVLSKNP